MTDSTHATQTQANPPPLRTEVAVIGGGPAGLMAAQCLAKQGLQVTVFDAMPSVGRKFLLAGRGGLNLTHSEAMPAFVSRYGNRQHEVGDWLAGFDANAVQAWAHALGVDTFVGTSGRIFPTDMKAAPLLRAWLAALRASGVQFHMRHRWTGWAHGSAPQASGQARDTAPLRFATPHGEQLIHARATVLALGGGSWARLGSDGQWVPLLQAAGVAVAPLLPANCGFDVARADPGDHMAADSASHEAHVKGWSPFFADKFAGQPFKSVAIHCQAGATSFERKGEFVATQTGVEGSLIYAASALLRDAIASQGKATFHIDLLPDHTPERVLAQVSLAHGSLSLANHLKRRLGLDGIKTALLHEVLGKHGVHDTALLAATIKAVPITVLAPRPIDEAISTAGGVALAGLTPTLMCKAQPGVFCAGEMLDWEAPTGGYLLTAALASGVRAARGVAGYLQDGSAA